jgi:hypothetical protein
MECVLIIIPIFAADHIEKTAIKNHGKHFGQAAKVCRRAHRPIHD